MTRFGSIIGVIDQVPDFLSERWMQGAYDKIRQWGINLCTLPCVPTNQGF